MGQVRAVAARQIGAPAQQVFDAVADYAGVRGAVLPAQYSDYAVRSGGTGAGTVAEWRLAATKKRVRHVVASVEEPAARTLVERDANSSMVGTWTVVDAPGGGSTVTLETVWNGAGGIGGFFERTFAPKGLARIHGELLANLAARVEKG